MKKFIKSFMVAVMVLLVATANTFGAILSTNISNAATNNVLATSFRLNQLTVANATAATLTLTIYDAPSTGFTYTNSSYSALSVYGPTNVVTTYTNFFGVAESWTNKTMYYTTNSVSASTNNYRQVLQLTVPTATTQVYTPDSVVQFNYGMLVVQTTNTSLTVDYLRFGP